MDEQTQKTGFLQILVENKKLLIIVLVSIVAVVIGVSVFIGAKSSNEYQGLIKRLDTETQELNKASQTNVVSPEQNTSKDSTASQSDEIIPASSEDSTPAKVAR